MGVAICDEAGTPRAAYPLRAAEQYRGRGLLPRWILARDRSRASPFTGLDRPIGRNYGHGMRSPARCGCKMQRPRRNPAGTRGQPGRPTHRDRRWRLIEPKSRHDLDARRVRRTADLEVDDPGPIALDLKFSPDGKKLAIGRGVYSSRPARLPARFAIRNPASGSQDRLARRRHQQRLLAPWRPDGRTRRVGHDRDLGSGSAARGSRS